MPETGDEVLDGEKTGKIVKVEKGRLRDGGMFYFYHVDFGNKVLIFEGKNLKILPVNIV
jgi:ribosomal protein L14E/L6E/L27E